MPPMTNSHTTTPAANVPDLATHADPFATAALVTVAAVSGVVAARRKAGKPGGAFSMLVQDRFSQFTQSH